MYKSDFLQEKSSFHPELLALNEREHLIEVILTNAACINRDEKAAAVYITDYPLLCYLAEDDQDGEKAVASLKS